MSRLHRLTAVYPYHLPRYLLLSVGLVFLLPRLLVGFDVVVGRPCRTVLNRVEDPGVIPSMTSQQLVPALSSHRPGSKSGTQGSTRRWTCGGDRYPTSSTTKDLSLPLPFLTEERGPSTPVLSNDLTETPCSLSSYRFSNKVYIPERGLLTR